MVLAVIRNLLGPHHYPFQFLIWPHKNQSLVFVEWD